MTIPFEVDRGACVLDISDKYYEENFKKFQLQGTELVLSSYVNDPLKPLGEISVNVEYKSKSKVRDLYVISNGANPLLCGDRVKESQLVI